MPMATSVIWVWFTFKGFRGNFMEGRNLDAFPEGPRLEESWRKYQRMDLGGGRGGGIQCGN
jgi:hypothetical protein